MVKQEMSFEKPAANLNAIPTPSTFKRIGRPKRNAIEIIFIKETMTFGTLKFHRESRLFESHFSSNSGLYGNFSV